MVRWTDTKEFAAPPDDQEPDDERPPGRFGGRRAGIVLWILVLLLVGFTALRVLGVAGNAITVPLLAATPYAVSGAALLALVCFVFRRKVLGAAALVLATALTVPLVPRVTANDQPAARGESLRIMTANLYYGEADAAAVVRLAREHDVDVLALSELTAQAEAALDDAGLADVLPNRISVPGGRAEGSGVAARVPLRQIVLVENSGFEQPSVVVDLPGREDVELVAVHAVPPVGGRTQAWRSDLAALPAPEPDGRVRVLAGDFNATLDHAEFRAVLDRGYVDAAEQTGDGLSPTWSNWPFGPAITIDHVLVDPRCAVGDFAVLDLPGSDHGAVLTEVRLR